MAGKTWRDLIEEVDWEVEENGGPYKEYPDRVRYTHNGHLVWEDDFDKETSKNDTALYNCMLSAFKEDSFKLGGKRYSEWWKQENKRKEE